VGANLGSASESGGTGTGGSMGASRPAGTRSQNRAAKRATMGVRPKAVRGGRVSARQSRSSNIGLIALVAGAIAIGAAAIVLGNPFGTPAASPGASSGAVASHGDGTCPTSQPAALSPADARTVTMVTTKGTITMRIDGTVSPIAAGNFVALVACHFYDGIVFHRIMPGFVIQGGDPQGTGSGGPGYEIQDDPVDVPYKRGTVAMARTPQPNSQGSQFFIILSDDADSSLSAAEYPYAILGQVTAGMDVVDEIAKGENTGGNEGRALEPVTMTSVTVGPYVPASPAPSTAPSAAPSSAPSIAPTSAPS
jgi:cyclophilin family peptidyl-prolyl cis-trans isomerase